MYSSKYIITPTYYIKDNKYHCSGCKRKTSRFAAMGTHLRNGCNNQRKVYVDIHRGSMNHFEIPGAGPCKGRGKRLVTRLNDVNCSYCLQRISDTNLTQDNLNVMDTISRPIVRRYNNE